MTTDATIEKAKAVIEEMRELLAKLEAESATKRNWPRCVPRSGTGRDACHEAELAAMRATKRNWPERIEAGMVFRHGSVVHMVDTSGALVMIHGDQPGGKWIQWERAPLEYLGTSFAVLMIRTDAREPTGAELVGRLVEYFGMDGLMRGRGECVGYDHESANPYKIAGGRGWFNNARPAK